MGLRSDALSPYPARQPRRDAMTFGELKELWEKEGPQPVRHAIITPDKRAWFQACHQWLHAGVTRRDIASDWPAKLFPDDPRRRWVAELHLRLARAIAEHHWSSRSVPPDEVLRQMLDGQPPGAALVTLGEVRDLAVELCAAPPEGSAEVACEHLAGRQWNYRLRPVELDAAGQPRSVTVRFLLEYPGGGTVAQLTLELVRGGAGNFHPATPLLFLDFKPDFRWALELARQWAAARGNGCSSQHDIRWRVSLPAERMTGEAHAGKFLPWPDETQGTSGGLACGLGLAALLGRTDEERRWLAPELGEVAATGALLDADGRLNGVGAVNLEQKLGPAFAVAVERGLIRVLLYHASNDADVPGKWKAPGSAPQAMPVATLDEALEELGDELGPRQRARAATLRAAGEIEFLGGKLPMDRGFQTLRLGLPPKRAKDERGERFEELNPLTIEEVFAQFPQLMADAGRSEQVPQLVVLANPGCGKSVLLQHLAYEAALRREPLARWLPVSFALRRWQAFWRDEKNARARTLADFLALDESQRVEGVTAEHWKQWLKAGEVLLLADGLEAVSNEDGFPATLKDELHKWADRGCAFALVSRSVNFESLHGFDYPRFTLEPFSPEERDQFIGRYPDPGLNATTRAALLAELQENDRRLKEYEGLNAEACEQQREQQQGWAALNDLSTRPATLDLVCYLHGLGEPLGPDRRTLYSKAVEKLLARRSVQEDAPVELFPAGQAPEPETQRAVLARTLQRVFQARRLETFDKELFRKELRAVITEKDAHGLALHAVADANTEAKLVKAYETLFTRHSRLVNVDEGHALDDRFMDFLAGEGLATENVFALPADDVLAGHMVAWREPVLHACWHRLRKGGTEDVLTLVEALAGPAMPVTDVGWQKVILAGAILVKFKDALELAKPRGEAVLKQVRKRLVELIELESLPEKRKARKGLPVPERAEGGRVLGRLGDPRPGVGVIEVSPGKILPDILFTDVVLPTGKFRLGATDGDGKTIMVKIKQPYRIAKYPVTVGQYAAFVRAGGYDEGKYWAEAIAADQWRKNPDDGKGEVKDWQGEDDWRRGPFSWSETLEYANHPIVGVNWYEATAFCRWLTAELQSRPDLWPSGWNEKKQGHPVVKLPHEAEWEQAARWNGKIADQRTYPWGEAKTDADLGERCNCDYSGIGNPSTVGLFPRGKSKCEAYDLSGNVLEWCENWYDENWHDEEQNMRVVRGGSSLNDNAFLLSTKSRGLSDPDHRDDRAGLRCMVVGHLFR